MRKREERRGTGDGRGPTFEMPLTMLWLRFIPYLSILGRDRHKTSKAAGEATVPSTNKALFTN